MTAPEHLPYRISGRDLVSESEGLRVQVLSLAEGEVIPWHYHNIVSDIFVGVDGVTVIKTRAPRERFEIGPGEHCIVPAKTAHEVTGKDGTPCRFTIVQGIGEHDFNLVGGPSGTDG